ncbi:MAG: MBL fold metallo-hydrolase [Planctomycetota bacterium]
MFLRMIYDDKLAQAAYLIGCQRTGEAIVIDPERDVDRYIDLAAAQGLTVVAVAETHIHADFLSGAREMAEQVGAKVFVSGEGGPDWSYRWLDQKQGGGIYDHVALKHGDRFSIGNIGFQALHTPGHTPEHVAYLVTDHGSGADEPIGMISGDFVFVGDVGRPDLLETATGQTGAMEPSARTLCESVRTLDDIADYVQLWPGHGAGSACGKALGAVPTSTIGYERRFNPAIKAASDQARFVDFILEGQPEPPLYFATMKRDNRDGPAVLGGIPTPDRVGIDVLSTVDPSKVAIVDTRPWPEFRSGHLPGSLSFPLINSFCTDVGSMVGGDEDIYLVVDAERLDEVVRDLIRIGLDRIKGWCPPEEISSAATATIQEIEVADAIASVESGKFSVLDVRRATEFAGGHVPGAVNASHTRLASRVDDVPGPGPILVNCRSGARSARSCAYLQRLGYDVTNLAGGFLAWDASGAKVDR